MKNNQTSVHVNPAKVLLVVVNQHGWITVVLDKTWQKKTDEFVPLFTILRYNS